MQARYTKCLDLAFIELISKVDMNQHQNNLTPFNDYRIIICKSKPNEIPKVEAIINLSKFSFSKDEFSLITTKKRPDIGQNLYQNSVTRGTNAIFGKGVNNDNFLNLASQSIQ